MTNNLNNQQFKSISEIKSEQLNSLIDIVSPFWFLGFMMSPNVRTVNKILDLIFAQVIKKGFTTLPFGFQG